MPRLPPSVVDTRSLRERCVDLATKVKGILGLAHIPYKDEDDMVSDSDTHLATQQSIKAFGDAINAYVDNNCKDSVFFGDEVRTSLHTCTTSWVAHIESHFSNAPDTGNGIVFANFQAYAGIVAKYYGFRITQSPDGSAPWTQRGIMNLYDYIGYGNRPYMMQAPVDLANGKYFRIEMRETTAGGDLRINLGIAGTSFLTLIAGNVYISSHQTT